jgi:hypothetical protein
MRIPHPSLEQVMVFLATFFTTMFYGVILALCVGAGYCIYQLNVNYKGPQLWDVYTRDAVYYNLERCPGEDWFYRDGRRFKFNENYEMRPAN